MTFVEASLLVVALAVASVAAWLALERYVSRWFWTTRASKHRFGLVGMFIDRLRGEPARLRPAIAGAAARRRR